MKKMFLSLMMLCSINPIFGMEDDEECRGGSCVECDHVCDEKAPQALTEEALLAIARYVCPENTHLVRKIVLAWLEQHPNGTYREFLDEYMHQHNRSLPAHWLPAIRAGLDLIHLLGQSNMLIYEMVRSNCVVFPFSRAVWNGRSLPKAIFDLRNNHKRCWHSRYSPGDYESSTCSQGIIEYRHKLVNGEEHLPNIASLFDHERRLVEQDGQPVLLGIVIWHPDYQSDIFCANKKKLLEVVHNAQQPHHTVAVLLVNGDTRHIIIAHRGVAAVIPSIVIPVGVSKDQCRQIAQDAIARAINRQPVFRSILEAVHYLEGLGL